MKKPTWGWRAGSPMSGHKMEINSGPSHSMKISGHQNHLVVWWYCKCYVYIYIHSTYAFRNQTFIFVHKWTTSGREGGSCLPTQADTTTHHLYILHMWGVHSKASRYQKCLKLCNHQTSQHSCNKTSSTCTDGSRLKSSVDRYIMNSGRQLDVQSPKVSPPWPTSMARSWENRWLGCLGCLEVAWTSPMRPIPLSSFVKIWRLKMPKR